MIGTGPLVIFLLVLLCFALARFLRLATPDESPFVAAGMAVTVILALAFVLSLAPNNERARTGFVRRVMTAALPAGTVVGISTFISYLSANPGRDGTAAEQLQASTAALITLLIGAVWVLAVVARPYQWWRVGLVSTSALAYIVIFALPIARQKFMLDPSNVATTATAVLIGLVAAALIEGSWWIQGRVLGERCVCR